MGNQCWTVRCKSEGCGTNLILGRSKPKEKYKHAALPPLLRFSLTCSECKKTHLYTALDVEDNDIGDISPVHESREFHEAIVKASR